ncbi:MAG: tubulin-like doman-containing protein, partial [Terrimicrobiaceae bacterium]
MSEESKTQIPNHIIIGLGGTGGRIIRSLRRTIYEEFRDKNPVAYTRDENGKITGKTEHAVKLGYIYVDSNPELMGPEDSTWKIPGGTLQLGSASQVLIGAGNLRSVIDNVNSYPGIKPWIGSKESWNAILDGQVSDAQGGQKRRLGRFLFASSNGTNAPDSFNSRLQIQVSELTSKGDARCVFHICAGLAGGTGSGTVVDTVAQIRKQYPYAGTHLIVLYLMLPEANPDPSWARANYHANGYAALMELSAMSVGAYKPYDIAGNGQRIDIATIGINPVPAFDGCYVFSNVNENNKMVGVADYQLHSVVANFLFQKIVVVDDNDWAVGTLKKFEECENGDPQTGDNHPERASDEPGSSLLRSRRFLTFGIKRLVIPEEEIREYMCYCFARQMALQSLYNNWSDNFGYTQEPRNENVVEMVRSAEALNRWKISGDHLTLSSAILKHEDSWKSLDQEWDVV